MPCFGVIGCFLERRCMNEINTKSTYRYLELGFLLIISLAAITDFLKIKGHNFIQFSEIVFLVLLPFCFPLLKNLKFTRFDYLLIFYLLLHLGSFAIYQNFPTLAEFVGISYLFALYFLLSRFLSQVKNLDAFLTKAMVGLCTVAIVTGLISYLLHLFGITSKFMVFYRDYPYFGDVWRLRGFSWFNLLFSNICLCLFFLVILPIRTSWKYILTISGLLISLLTYSKELVLFLALYALLLASFRYKPLKNLKLLTVYSFALAVFMSTTTFFVIKPSHLSKANFNIENSKQIGAEAVFSIGQFDFYPTTYYFLFDGAIQLIPKAPLTGIGAGMFPEELDLLREQGRYPESISSLVVHDFYWGPTAELGLLYLVFLIWLFMELYALATNKARVFPEKYRFMLLLTFIFFLITFAIGGSKTYRQLWIFFAILNCFYLRAKG